jgi:hypothetical protein
MSGAEKTAAYRQRLRGRRLREIRLLVPDTRDPHIRAELKREIALLRDHPSSKEGEAFVEATLADVKGWTAP